jgi:hypothetical protein
MPQDDPKPPLSHENLVLNELIREYLEYNHYKVLFLCVGEAYIRQKRFRFVVRQHRRGEYLAGRQTASGLPVRAVHEEARTRVFPLKLGKPQHTVSVFTPETGQPAERINRTFLSQVWQAIHYCVP